MSYFVIVLLVAYLIYAGMYQLILGKIPGSGNYEERYTEESLKKYTKVGGIECILAGIGIAVYEFTEYTGNQFLPSMVWWIIGGVFLVVLMASFFLIVKKK